MEQTSFVYTTWPSLAEAEAAARGFVEAKLCACVNMLPGMVAIYAWEGKIERADETVMILKTRSEKVAALMDAVRSVHPYETPAIVELPVAAMDPKYRSWIVSETAP